MLGNTVTTEVLDPSNSLRTGKITGNFEKIPCYFGDFGDSHADSCSNLSALQANSLSLAEQGIFSPGTGNFFRRAGNFLAATGNSGNSLNVDRFRENDLPARGSAMVNRRSGLPRHKSTIRTRVAQAPETGVSVGGDSGEIMTAAPGVD